MTIEQAIDRADRLRPNAFVTTEKVRWLSELDLQVYSEVILMADKNWKYRTIEEEVTDGEGNVVEVKTVEDKSTKVPAFEFEGYDETTPLDTELLIDELYSNTYVDYLLSKYDLYSREINAYNNSALVFNNEYQNYCAWYRRNNEPITRRVRGI